MTARSLLINLAIGADDFVQLYQGRARDVVAKASNGQTVRFPANILRPHVNHNGVHGRFRLSFSENGKFLAIEKL